MKKIISLLSFTLFSGFTFVSQASDLSQYDGWIESCVDSICKASESNCDTTAKIINTRNTCDSSNAQCLATICLTSSSLCESWRFNLRDVATYCSDTNGGCVWDVCRTLPSSCESIRNVRDVTRSCRDY